MRRIIRLATLSVSLLAAGCLGGYQGGTQNPGGASGPTQSSTPTNQNSGSGGSGGMTPAPTPTQTGGSGSMTAMTPGPAAQAELVKFGSCMTQTDFTSTGMDKLSSQMTDAGPCYSCHSTGIHNAYLAMDATQTFTHLQQLPFLYSFAMLEVNPDGSFKDIVPSNRFIARGGEITLNHPSYVLDPANAQALTDFFNATMTHYKSGNCTGQ